MHLDGSHRATSGRMARTMATEATVTSTGDTAARWVPGVSTFTRRPASTMRPTGAKCSDGHVEIGGCTFTKA
jgi:hypothetical protein